MLLLALVASATVATALGAYVIDAGRLGRALAAGLGAPVSARAADVSVLWTLRVPRVALGAMVGSALAMAGALLQGALRNPLADPGIIGASSGAALAAAAVMVLLPAAAGAGGGSLLVVVAFGGAVLAVLAVLALSRGAKSSSALVLAGVAVNALCGALTGLLTVLADDGQLRALSFWTLGSLGNAGSVSLWLVAAALAPVWLLAVRTSDALDALSLGEFSAMTLGVDAARTRRSVIALAALAVGVSVSTCGVLSFVGLVAPHLVRMIAGPTHRTLLPASALCGAALVVLSDAAARTVAQPVELPLGVITALVGAPMFLWLLWRGRGEP
jgi:iron complex transport system permease protein